MTTITWQRLHPNWCLTKGRLLTTITWQRFSCSLLIGSDWKREGRVTQSSEWCPRLDDIQTHITSSYHKVKWFNVDLSDRWRLLFLLSKFTKTQTGIDEKSNRLDLPLVPSLIHFHFQCDNLNWVYKEDEEREKETMGQQLWSGKEEI